MIKVGCLVRYVPDPSALFKWEGRLKINSRLEPGIVIEQLEYTTSHTRRYKVRWHGGVVTDEWVTHLVKYESVSSG